MKRLFSLFVLILLLAVVGCSEKEAGKDKAVNAANAEEIDYPEKPIELIIPFAPGGTTDVFARAIAKEAQDELGENIVPVNKPGGAQTLGLTSILKAKPDGYEIALSTNSGLDIQPHYGDTAYEHDDFAPAIKLYEIPAGLQVVADSDIETFEDWVEYCKANPGEFTYGVSGGAGSAGHIFMEKLADELDIDIEHIPFEGVSELMTALLSGEIMGANMIVDTDEQLRPLFWSGEVKDPRYTDIPTVGELELESSVDYYTGLLAPKDTPDEVVQKLHDAFQNALEDPSVEKVMENLGVVKSYGSQEDYANTIKKSSDKNYEMMLEQGLIEE